MKQILNYMPLDIVPHPDGFVIIEPNERDENGRLRVSFWFYDLKTMVVQKVKKSFYSECKFGPAHAEITKQINDYISCAVCENPRDYRNVIFPTGEMGIFDTKGSLIWTGDLLYHGSTLRSAAPEGKNLWCAVPDQNAIVRYNRKLERIDFRIGGRKTNAFGRPMSITRYGKKLYVCCKTSQNIKQVALKDYTVEEYCSFEEPVLRYLRIGEQEIVVLSSGIYLLDEQEI